MCKRLSVSLIAAALLELAVGVSVAGAQAREIVREDVTLRGTVEAVDYGARTVIIRGPQGNFVTLDVPPSAVRFDQVKVGDTVIVSYYDRVNLRLKPAGEAAVDSRVDAATLSPGATPGGTLSAQRIATVTITGWDPATRVVSYTGPRGNSYSRHVSETVASSVLSGLKVGDRVDVTWTEAVTLSVESPSGAARAAPAAAAAGAAAAAA